MPTGGSATPGAAAGTRCGCSPPPATTGCLGCPSRHPPSPTPPRTRSPTTWRPTRPASTCRSRPASASTGNSGAEIAFEVAGSHPTWLSGPDTGHLPVRTGGAWDRLLTPPFWWFASRVLTVQTPIGRKVRPKALTANAPLERVRPKELAAAGVERVPRTVGVRDGLPLLEDGCVMEVATVLWCTGLRPEFAFIDLPVFDQDGPPLHYRGVVQSQPGLYVLGLWFLSGFTSSLLGGVGRDAEHIAEQIVARSPRLQQLGGHNGQPTGAGGGRRDRRPGHRPGAAAAGHRS